MRFPIPRVLSVLLWVFALVNGLRAPANVLAENVIRGFAENLTSGQPAAGDEVLLLGMDRKPDTGGQPATVARTRTDARGAFLLPAPAPGITYLVRVLHQGVAYDEQASAGDNFSMAVFDARPRVTTITGTIEILRLGTRAAEGQKLLHVSDMYEIRNDSNPPMTEAGDSTFEVYLPANARIGSVLAAATGVRLEEGKPVARQQIGRTISATPVAGEPGHYTVNFPLRPGATSFAFNYDLPYPNHALFETRRQYGFQEFAVMMPWTMRFSSPSSAFHPLTKSQDPYQVQAVIQSKAGRGPRFEVSGYGAPPSLPTKVKQQAEQSHSPALPSSAGNRAPRMLPGAVAGFRRESETPPRWRRPVVAAFVLLACIILVLLGWRFEWLTALQRANARLGAPRRASASPLESLKQELFQLEVDRVSKSISSEEYSSARRALEETVKRAALRAASGGRMVGTRSPKAGKT